MSSDLLPHVVQPRFSTIWLGNPYFYEEKVDSTNSCIDRLAKQGGTHGTVLVANSQTSGRGRLKRPWHSPAGVNLYFSVLLRPDWTVGTAKPVSLAAGVALAEAVELLLPGTPEVKWPNDLLWKGRKLAGILVESATDREKVHYIVLGIGLNINQHQFPKPLAGLASSLSLVSGKPFQRSEVLATILARLELWIDHLQQGRTEQVIDAWTRFAPWIGSQITVHNGDQVLAGKALGLNPQGALRLQDEQGREHLVVSGDVGLNTKEKE